MQVNDDVVAVIFRADLEDSLKNKNEQKSAVGKEKKLATRKNRDGHDRLTKFCFVEYQNRGHRHIVFVNIRLELLIDAEEIHPEPTKKNVVHEKEMRKNR